MNKEPNTFGECIQAYGFKEAAAMLGRKFKAERRKRTASCTDSPECRDRGCDDCERSYGPKP